MSEGIQEAVSERIEQVEHSNALLNRLLHLFDYVFLLRPTLFFPIWTIFVAGYVASIRFVTGQAYGVIEAVSYGDFLWAGVGLTLLMGGAFVINQIADEEVDRANNKLFLIANGCVSQTAARVEAGVVTIAGLAIAGFVDWRLAAVFGVIFLVTGVLYSLPPFKWKDKALPGFLLNGLGFLLIFAAGWLVYSPPVQEFFLIATPYVFSVLAVYLYTTLLDQKGDKRHNKITFAIKFGKEKTIQTGALLLFFALAISYVFDDAVIFYPALFALPLFLIAVFRQQIRAADRAIKYPILFLALAISMIWTWFFMIILVNYYFSKVYYKYRFGMNYPSFEHDRAETGKSKRR